MIAGWGRNTALRKSKAIPPLLKKSSAGVTAVISGRDFHSNESSAYWLPKDEEEQDRLIGQHFAIKEIYEGNFLSEVPKYVSFETGARICDIGCGAGAWLMDMALEYPKCTFDGVDMVEVTQSEALSDRLNIIYSDVTDVLDYPDNTFDFVHMRLFVLALREDEWEHAIREAVRITKPGGVIQLLEYYFTPDFDDHPAVGKTANAIIDTMGTRGQDPYIGPKQPRYLTEAGCKVIQVDNRPIDMSNNTAAAKKFLWNWQRVLKSMMPILGPNLGLNDPIEQQQHGEEVLLGLTKCRKFYWMYSAAGQKL
ncbi:S-adenosyl-L-methionine-dependent methyltransferase [Zychaea mexicana]|uniref:S-adenosyl-L-methionine-dependent methyltransferase n=1 Tax=Zychaea mexicana TaxID=64656 RepID=UPI0022FEBE4D|nr:S-adenosyl-L-methionine-dependent methyltransferase [Zychaea mexicana]KAI9489578.1 S-adenosyl-L-methionine-dependent methyltransferase [Zychaea mexicana]